MATAATPAAGIDRERRFFLTTAIIIAVIVAGAFSFQRAMGRSSFAVPLYIHAHALIFFGWVTLYLTQNALVAGGSVALHRRLGWLAVGWIPAMVIAGAYVTVMAARTGRVPFFFLPGYFLVMNPLTTFTFAGLSAAAIAMRRQTLWHRRLMLCGTAILAGPGFGRLLPMPLMGLHGEWFITATVLLFPLAGILHDRRTRGAVHPAWWWGVGTIVAMQVAIDLIAFSPLGLAIYHAATAGWPGATIPPMMLPPPPAF